MSPRLKKKNSCEDDDIIIVLYGDNTWRGCSVYNNGVVQPYVSVTRGILQGSCHVEFR